MSRASDSRAIILGVVPDATSEWNPEIAPHAIVMNANGKSFPANTGPSPSDANGVRPGMRTGGGVPPESNPGAQRGGVFPDVGRESRRDKRIHPPRSQAMQPCPLRTHTNAVAAWGRT